jgi:hypothetical protein
MLPLFSCSGFLCLIEFYFSGHVLSSRATPPQALKGEVFY